MIVAFVDGHIIIKMLKISEVDWSAHPYQVLDNLKKLIVVLTVGVLVLPLQEHKHHSKLLG